MLRICLFFSIPEPEYAYKRYAYKKNVLESESHIIISNVDYHFSFVFQEHLEVSVLEYWEWYGLDLL